MKRILFILLAAAISFSTLTGCGNIQIAVLPSDKQSEQPPARLPADAATTPDRLPLGLQSDSETIRQRLLFSHTTWQSLWANAETLYYNPENPGGEPTERFRTQIWVEPNRLHYRVLTGDPEGSPKFVQVSDGSQDVFVNLQSGETERSDLSPYTRDVEKYVPPTVVSDTVYPHPLTGALRTPLSEMIFPSGFGQRSGTFTPVRMEFVAGREALVVEWRREADVLVDRFWIDTQTNILLRWQNFGKPGGDQLVSDIILTAVEINPALNDALFNPQIGEPPHFVTDSSAEQIAETSASPGANSNGQQPVQTAGAQPELADPSQDQQVASAPVGQFSTAPEGGELYFTLMGNDNGTLNMRLVRMPAACLLDGSACPALQEVPGYPNRDQSILPLRWAPDGSLAVVPYLALSGNNMTALYRYNPADGNWASLTEAPIINEVAWSNNSRWLAVVTQDNENVQRLLITRPDGSQAQTVAESDMDLDFQHLFLGGWRGDQLIFTVSNRHASRIFGVYPQAKAVELRVVERNDAMFFPAPNGKMIVTVERTSGDALLRLDAAGDNPLTLASFQNASIGAWAWSPDSQWIAFSVYDNGSQVYAIRPDGSDLRQVYSGGDVTNMVFSPDSSRLLIESAKDGLFHLYITALDGGNAQILQAPGLRLDEDWMGVSWRYPPAS